MKTEYEHILNSVELDSHFEIIIDATKVDTLGVQAVYAPIGGGSGTLQTSVSIDGLHYTNFPVEKLTILTSDSSIWSFRDPFYNWIKMSYTPISGSIILSIIKCLRNRSSTQS